jgi:hypothetical protein
VTINKNIKPSVTDINKIFNGEGVNVGSFEPTPIKSFIILFKKNASDTH